MPDDIVCVDGASLVVGIGGRGGVRIRLYVRDESSAEVGVVNDLKWSRFYTSTTTGAARVMPK
jgi:hypothetical protein